MNAKILVFVHCVETILYCYHIVCMTVPLSPSLKFKVFPGRKKLRTGKENEKEYHKGQSLLTVMGIKTCRVKEHRTISIDEVLTHSGRGSLTSS